MHRTPNLRPATRFSEKSPRETTHPTSHATPAAGSDGPLFIDAGGHFSRRLTDLPTASNKEVRLLLLDFDGTLADTREANYQAYARTLAEEGISLSRESYLARYFGMRCAEFMQAVGFADRADQERLRQRKIALYPSYFDSLRLNRPLWDYAQQLRARGGRVWIVSTGSRANIRHAMEYLGLTEGIDGILTGEDVLHSKPAPDCFLQAMQAEGMTPAQTLIFEDSAVGLEAARRSGAAAITVRF